jgi:hypothetical protein
MDVTKIRFKAKVVNNDPMTNPDNGIVEGFYYQDLDNGIVKHYIHNCPMTWEVDPATLRIAKVTDIPNYKNPITKLEDIKDLQERLVQCCIDFIKERNLTEIWGINLSVDGLPESVEFGEWMGSTDSHITIEGLQMDEDYGFKTRAFIGEYM